MRVQHSGSCITFFARGDSPYRTHSLRILSNLAKSHGQKILNEADAMTTVCNLITATELTKELNSSEERYCICVICLLADDSCNRAKVRKSGAFKHLLQVAKNTDNEPLLIMVCYESNDTHIHNAICLKQTVLIQMFSFLLPK